MTKELGKKILIVKSNDLDTEGVTSFLMSRVPKIATANRATIYLLTAGKIVDKQSEAALRNAGVSIIEAHATPHSSWKSQRRLRDVLEKIMSRVSFDVIHVNTASVVVEYHSLQLAKRHDIPVRIAHSHSTAIKQHIIKSILASLYRQGINRYATTYLACSTEAGEYLYGAKVWSQKGRLFRNGIDVERYAFNLETRKRIRENYCDDSRETVFGFVGNLIDVKNPLYLLRLFEILHNYNQRARLWIVGNGPLLETMQAVVQGAHLSGAVRFFGRRWDVDELMQGMDAFILPSLYEGLGLVLIEAQAAGLPAFVSDRVPSESHIPGCPLTFLSLDVNPTVWADTIVTSSLSRNIDGKAMVKAAGYDLESSIEDLTYYYSL